MEEEEWYVCFNVDRDGGMGWGKVGWLRAWGGGCDGR